MNARVITLSTDGFVLFAFQEKSVNAVKTKPAAQKPAQKNVLRGKNPIKKKREHLRYGIDCTNIAEDNIMDVADFVSIQ